MAKVIGIDDAGRGPVIGPMALAGVLIDDEDLDTLKEWGVRDSKTLTRRKRLIIQEGIKQDFDYHVELAYPHEIDTTYNLNTLEAIKTAMVVNALTADLQEPVKVIIDCPSVNIRAWTKEILGMIKRQDIVSVVCEHKADRNHMVVAAASIMAKEAREAELDELRKQLGVDFGSGYPADPVTKEFIREHFDNPAYSDIIRSSWATVKALFKGKKQKKLAL